MIGNTSKFLLTIEIKKHISNSYLLQSLSHYHIYKLINVTSHKKSLSSCTGTWKSKNPQISFLQQKRWPLVFCNNHLLFTLEFIVISHASYIRKSFPKPIKRKIDLSLTLLSFFAICKGLESFPHLIPFLLRKKIQFSAPFVSFSHITIKIPLCILSFKWGSECGGILIQFILELVLAV